MTRPRCARCHKPTPRRKAVTHEGVTWHPHCWLLHLCAQMSRI